MWKFMIPCVRALLKAFHCRRYVKKKFHFSHIFFSSSLFFICLSVLASRDAILYTHSHTHTYKCSITCILINIWYCKRTNHIDVYDIIAHYNPFDQRMNEWMCYLKYILDYYMNAHAINVFTSLIFVFVHDKTFLIS